MRVSIQEVEYVASLSRLELSEDEKLYFQGNLDKVLELAERLVAVDTEGVEPTAHILPTCNVFREDKAMPSMDRDELVRNAPESSEGCFLVPKTVE